MISVKERQLLVEQTLQTCDNQASCDDLAIRRIIYGVVARAYAESKLTLHERRQIVQQVYDSMRGLDILQPLIEDPAITEIMVNGPDKIFVERHGRLLPSPVSFESHQHLMQVVNHCFGQADRLLHERQPCADMCLDSGARIHAVLPPVARNGPILCIRKFTGIQPDLDTLIKCGSLTRQAADYLAQAVYQRKTIFICGGTGSGKTTFLNILSAHIPDQERVITIEDSAELQLQNLANLVRLESRSAGPDGQGEISLRDLIRTSLRMRPDRIIVGEVRGEEAFDMLQAMNTGHPGSLCTGHANSCQDMLARLALMILMAVQLPWDAVRGLIASALDIMIFLVRNPQGQRLVAEICEISGLKDNQYVLKTIFLRSSEGELEHVI